MARPKQHNPPACCLPEYIVAVNGESRNYLEGRLKVNNGEFAGFPAPSSWASVSPQSPAHRLAEAASSSSLVAEAMNWGLIQVEELLPV